MKLRGTERSLGYGTPTDTNSHMNGQYKKNLPNIIEIPRVRAEAEDVDRQLGKYKQPPTLN
jgi:hypothetical protein